MVLDTSVLLAVLFNEASGPRVAEYLEEYREALRMSTVNLTEVLILLQDRQPQLFESLRDSIYESGIRFVSPTTTHAEIAAAARLRYPLNLGDCFAYALAHNEQDLLLTLDSDFRKTDIEVIVL